MPLLPVSIVDTPSIMTLVLLPPEEARSAMRLVPLTPGESDASAVKLRFEIGTFCTDVGVIVNDRSALCVCRSCASALTVRVSATAPTSTVSGPRPTLSPALTAMPVRRSVLKP